MNVLSGEVEYELVPTFATHATWVVQNPVGVRTVQVAVFVNHFRFDPDAKLHVQFANVGDQVAKAFGKVLRAWRPIAQSRVIVDPSAEPSIVDNE